MATKAQSAVLTSVTTSTVIPVSYFDTLNNPISVFLAITNTPTLTANVEGTLDNIQDPTVTPVWFSVTGGNALAASALIVVNYPVRAIRLNVTAWTAGNAQITVLQGD